MFPRNCDDDRADDLEYEEEEQEEDDEDRADDCEYEEEEQEEDDDDEEEEVQQRNNCELAEAGSVKWRAL